MKKNNKKKKVISIMCIIIIIVLCVLIYLKINNSKSNASKSTTDNINSKLNTDDGDSDIDWSGYTDTDYKLKDSISITDEGIYNLTGTINDGLITINSSGNVKLNLNNVNITNSKGPAIYVKSAENVVINLVDGSNNTITDGNTYQNYDQDVSAAIYSCDDLVFDGTGSLVINANYQDAIVSKDDLKIINGTYKIESNDDGIRGKDSLYILNGNFYIKSGADGLKSTNDTDEEKGFVLVENGNITIDAEEDGIQAETKVVIQDGAFNITTGGSSSNSSSKSSWGNWSDSGSNQSAKGIKSVDNLVINGGKFVFDTSDDAIHSNNYVGIKSGDISISSGDDGIHADVEIIIDDGTINITKSYEAIESSKITINNGIIKIAASDDGINVAGGNDSSSMDRPGANTYSDNTDNILTINGGNVYINAVGDGIDINGSGYINGGSVIVEGPTSDGNGILDYDKELVAKGGEIIAAGSSGMFQGLSSNSEVYNVNIYFSSTVSANKTITIVDSSSNEIISYTPSKSINAMVVATSKFKNKESYTIKIDGSNYSTFTVSSISTNVGSNYNSMGGGNRGPGGGRR